jgi:hypothetical protein
MVLRHPGLQSCSWTLFTKDAHALYARFGFERPTAPETAAAAQERGSFPLGENA